MTRVFRVRDHGLERAKITIDGKSYEFDAMPPSVAQQIEALEYIDARLQRLQQRINIAQVARAFHAQILKSTLVTKN